MTHVDFLGQLQKETKTAVSDIIMPTRIQKADEEQQYRAAEVYRMRLPNSSAAQKKAPYIIHQLITSKDMQPLGNRIMASAVVRSIFCVYHADE